MDNKDKIITEYLINKLSEKLDEIQLELHGMAAEELKLNPRQTQPYKYSLGSHIYLMADKVCEAMNIVQDIEDVTDDKKI